MGIPDGNGRTPIYDHEPIKTLAMRYVIAMDEPGAKETDAPQWILKQRMLARCGPDWTRQYIEEAEQTLKLLGD